MFWILAISYFIHLLATVVWLGGMTMMALVAWPALRRGTLAHNQWLNLQRRFAPWVNVSLILLLVTGFIQMTNDVNYTGFLQIDSLWAGAILVKHIAVFAMIGIAAFTQFRIYPAIDRLELLSQTRPELAQTETAQLTQQENRLLRLNLLSAAAVLFFTAIATAV